MPYPLPPGRRIPWDRDGTAMFHITNGGVLTTGDASVRQSVNDETNTATGPLLSGSTSRQGVIFPTPQTIQGVYVCQTNGVSGFSWRIEYSLDSTTGADGTWSTLRAAGQYGQEQDVPTTYRTVYAGSGTALGDFGIFTGSPLPLSSVKGIRVYIVTVTGSPRLSAMHLYGYPSTPAGNRLALWHATLDQPLYDFPSIYDHGDVPRGSGLKTLSFRVKNVSPSLTALSVSVMREALTDGSPTIVSLTSLRYNGGAYGATAAVGNLAPGAISQIVDATINVDSTAPVGVWAPRCIAYAASWA